MRGISMSRRDARVALVCIALTSSGCALITQPPIYEGDRTTFFTGGAVSGATSNQQAALNQASADCAGQINRLRSNANAIYATKNILTALGIAGAGAGGIIAAASPNDSSAAAVTAISGAAVAALAQIVTTIFWDPVTTKDKYVGDFQWWSDAEDYVSPPTGGTPNYNAAVQALLRCGSDAAPPAKATPAGATLVVNNTPVVKPAPTTAIAAGPAPTSTAVPAPAPAPAPAPR